MAFTQGGGLSGLALGYCLAAPSGAPAFAALLRGEPEATGKTGDAEDLVVVWANRRPQARPDFVWLMVLRARPACLNRGIGQSPNESDPKS